MRAPNEVSARSHSAGCRWIGAGEVCSACEADLRVAVWCGCLGVPPTDGWLSTPQDGGWFGDFAGEVRGVGLLRPPGRAGRVDTVVGALPAVVGPQTIWRARRL